MTPRAEEVKPILDCNRNPYWFFLFHTFLSSFPSQRFCEGHDYLCPIKLTDHSNPSQDLQPENASSFNKGCFSHFECSFSVGRTTNDKREKRYHNGSQQQPENWWRGESQVSQMFSYSFLFPVKAKLKWPLVLPPLLPVLYLDVFTYL